MLEIMASIDTCENGIHIITDLSEMSLAFVNVFVHGCVWHLW